MIAKTQRSMSLVRWAETVFGEYAPSRYTLDRWARRGQIQPPPKWVRGQWRVDPAARYEDRPTSD